MLRGFTPMQSAPAARSLRLSLSRLSRCRSSFAARMTLRVDTSIATPTAFRDPLWENELIEKIRYHFLPVAWRRCQYFSDEGGYVVCVRMGNTLESRAQILLNKVQLGPCAAVGGVKHDHQNTKGKE